MTILSRSISLNLVTVITLRLQRAHEGRTVPSEFLPDHRLQAIVEHILRNARALLLKFLELLEDQLPIERSLIAESSHLLDLVFQFRAAINLAQANVRGRQ